METNDKPILELMKNIDEGKIQLMRFSADRCRDTVFSIVVDLGIVHAMQNLDMDFRHLVVIAGMYGSHAAFVGIVVFVNLALAHRCLAESLFHFRGLLARKRRRHEIQKGGYPA